jgi:branched-subunit amino acid transport protein
VTWLTVAAVAALCYALRAAVPLLLAGRELPEPVVRRLGDAVPPLLAALAAIQLSGRNGLLAVDARLAGVAAGVSLFAWRRSLLLALVTAGAVTAAIRAF